MAHITECMILTELIRNNQSIKSLKCHKLIKFYTLNYIL